MTSHQGGSRAYTAYAACEVAESLLGVMMTVLVIVRPV
jgi:hypothetical protein